MSQDVYPPIASHEPPDSRATILSVPFLADQLPIGIVIEDAAHAVRYANRAFCSLFGLDEYTVSMGIPSRTLIAHITAQAADAPELLAYLDASVGAGGPRHAFKLLDGRQLELERIALQPEAAARQGTLWLFEDMTERRQLDASLAAATQQLERMTSYAPVSLFELDAEGRVVTVDGRTTSLPGIQREHLIGRTVTHFARGLTPEELQHNFARLASGHTIEAQIDLDGYTIQLRMSPVLNAQGELERIFGVALDVTDRHRVETALRQTEAAYISTIESLEDGYYELDRAGDLTAVNDALCRMFGYTREQMLSDPVRHVIEYMAVDHIEALIETFRRVYHSGQPRRALEASIRRSDGETVMIEMSITLIHDSQGRRAGYRGIARDITARKQIEAALNRRMNLLGILQQVNYDLNQTLDMDIVLSVALNAAMVLSEADAGFIGMLEDAHLRLVRSIGYNDVERVEADPFRLPIDAGIIGRVMRQRMGELIVDVRADADYVPDIGETQAQLAVPLFSQERLIGILNLETSARDHFNQEVFEFVNVLTARISAAIDNARLYTIAQAQLVELRGLNTQLSQLEQMKTDMIRVAAHDLKNPLSIAVGYIGVLREDLDAHLDDAHRAFFDVIDRSLSRISRMSTDILSLERITAQPNAQLKTVDLRALTHEAGADQEQVQPRQMTLTLDLPDAPLTVRCDPATLLEAIYNLLTNAVKYTPDGGRIEVRMGAHLGRAWLEIEDTGYGIPDEMQPRLFQAFYRAKTEATDHIDGTGLGLYLVKRIVEEHGGRMRFRSQVGVGSMFGFDLPLAEKALDEMSTDA